VVQPVGRTSDPVVRTQLLNRVLGKLGAARVASITETHPAVAAFTDAYPRVRQFELTRHPWKVAMVRTGLPAAAEAPAWGWAYAYPLPDECLRLWQVTDGTWAVTSYAVEAGAVLADQAPPLRVSYTRDLGDVALHDVVLFEALAAHLAWDLCDSITGSPARKPALISEYSGLIEDARRTDAIEGPVLRASSFSPWIAARFGGDGGALYDGLVSPLPRPRPLDGDG
jgi:hypothetical protein